MIHGIDILLLVLLALVAPIVERRDYQKIRPKLASGEPGARLAYYGRAIRWEWGFTAVLVAFWLGMGRSFAELGLGAPESWRFWAGLTAALALSALLFWQGRGLDQRPKDQESVRRQLEGALELMPETRRELTRFSWLSITAGVCEEIVYRGFLIWLLAALVGPVTAVIGSSLIFGAGHLYLGVRGALRATILGLILALLFVFTGSLWAPILLHAAMDLASGRLAYASSPARSDGVQKVAEATAS